MPQSCPTVYPKSYLQGGNQAAVIPFETSDLSAGEQLGKRIARLKACLNAAQAEFLELLCEFDEQRYWENLGFTSCAHWLNFRCGIGFNAARERLRMAHALVKLPKIRAGFAEGTLSFSKVRAMTRVATPENLLLNIAYHGAAYHVERFVSQYRQIEKLREPGFAQDLHEQRELTHYYGGDGCPVIKARLPAEQGELVVKALERAMEQQDACPDEDTEKRQPVAARRADALSEVPETYLNDPENAGSTADRYQVVLHVQADRTVSAGGFLENGPCVSADSVPSG